MAAHDYQFFVACLATGLFLQSALVAEARVQDSSQLAGNQKVRVQLKLTTTAPTLAETDKNQKTVLMAEVSETLSKNGFEVLAPEMISNATTYPIVNVSILAFNRLELPSNLLYFDIAIQLVNLVNKDSPNEYEKKQLPRPVYRHVTGIVKKDEYSKRIDAELKSLVKGFINEYSSSRKN